MQNNKASELVVLQKTENQAPASVRKQNVLLVRPPYFTRGRLRWDRDLEIIS